MEKKEVFKNNLIKYRKQAGLTQLDLAQQLGYSNKSVSKWERGESVPDMDTLLRIAEVFGVSLSEMIAEPDGEQAVLPEPEVLPDDPLPVVDEKPTEQKRRSCCCKMENRVLWLLLSIAILLSVTTVLFFAVRLSCSGFARRAWLFYVYDAPLIFTGVFVFICCVQKRVDAVLLSCMVWTYVAAIFLTFMHTEHMWEVFVVGVPLQFLAIVFSLLCNLHIRIRRERREREALESSETTEVEQPALTERSE